MRAFSLASFVGLMIWVIGPAHALPTAAPMTAAAPDASLAFLLPAQWPFPLTAGWPFLLPAGHHGHHGHWGYGRQRWSRHAPPYGQAPELNAAEVPATGYPTAPGYAAPGYATAPRYAPATGSAEPPAMAPAPAQNALNRGGEAPVQTPSGRASEAPAATASSAPSIQWVNPDRTAR